MSFHFKKLNYNHAKNLHPPKLNQIVNFHRRSCLERPPRDRRHDPEPRGRALRQRAVLDPGLVVLIEGVRQRSRGQDLRGLHGLRAQQRVRESNNENAENHEGQGPREPAGSHTRLVLLDGE